MLQTSFELVLPARDDVEMFVGKPAPLLLHFALHLLLVTLDTIRVLTNTSVETIFKRQAFARSSKP